MQIITLPLATHMLLRPHRDDFAAALAATGDVRATLTDLMNRFPAVATGAAMALRLHGTSHVVDVLAMKGLRHVRCGTVAAVAPADDATSGASESVPAACLVDADVEVDFAPSIEHEAKEHASNQAAQAQAQAALEEARSAEGQRRRQQEEQANPWSAGNVGTGHALGSEGAESQTAPAPMSDREKRLAALARRGL